MSPIAAPPDMDPIRVVGGIDDHGDSKDPVCMICPVTEPGKKLDNKGCNHADYIDDQGGYDIVRYLIDFTGRFAALNHVGFCQLVHHISTEVDYESLFS